MAGQNNTPTVDEIVRERGARYGSVHSQFGVAVGIKRMMEAGLSMNNRFIHMPPEDKAVIQEGLDMIATKISRIVVGDPRYKDNWDDISGYAKITGEAINPPQENEK